MDKERIIEIERLQSALLVSRGTFHQFGNHLTLINGYTGLIKMSLAPGSEEYDLVDRVDGAVKQASTLLDATHAFVRGKPTSPSRIDCAKVVSEVCHLVDDTFPMLEMQVDLPGDPVWVTADSRRLQDAVVHLVLNAFEAMGQRGEITVAVRRIEGEVQIGIADGGPGMESSDIEKSREEWFTTGRKDGLFATGLGLPASRAIVEEMGGRLVLESTSGEGLEARLVLPETP